MDAKHVIAAHPLVGPLLHGLDFENVTGGSITAGRFEADLEDRSRRRAFLPLGHVLSLMLSLIIEPEPKPVANGPGVAFQK
jgi:hypothetical protein